MTDPRSVRASTFSTVIFDMDGVVIDSQAAANQALVMAAAKHGVRTTKCFETIRVVLVVRVQKGEVAAVRRLAPRVQCARSPDSGGVDDLRRH